MTERVEHPNPDQHGGRSAGAGNRVRELTELLKNSGDAIVSIDLEGNVVGWNAHAEDMYGWSEQEAVGCPLRTLIIPVRYHEEHLARLREFAETGTSPYIGRRVEVESRRRDGTEFPAELWIAVTDTAGAVMHHVFIRDISDRRRGEQALRTSEEQFRSLVANIPGVVYRCAADADWTMEYISDDIQGITGYPASDFLGNCIRSFASVIHEEDRRSVEEEVDRGIAGARPYMIEYRVLCADGGVRWVYEKGQPMLGEDGTPRWLDGVILDITDRKLAESERERLLAAEQAARTEAEAARAQLAEQNEQLREVDRLKDDFVALVSHELRTPLTSILGYLDLMLEEDAQALATDHREFLDIVRRNSERLLNLVGDLLFVAQVAAGKLTLETQPVDLARVARNCAKAMESRAAERLIDLQLDTSGAVTIHGDSSRLAQLVDNLVSNAIKFTPEHGRVVVGVTREQDGVVLTVADTGIGISEEDQARLFERFFRTEGAMRLAIQGTGLGLTIAKAITEAHSGAISVESRQGAGTVFRVTFPIAAEAASDIAA